MKAAILKEIGTIPVFMDVPEPFIENSDQVLVKVKTSSIKQLDLLRASGKHYTTYPSLPTTVGMDGVAVLDNGQRIYAMGVTGMMAEKAIVKKDTWVNVPDGLSDEIAAELPHLLAGSDIALTIRGKMKEGDTVLINGATGATGMVAVQMAKYHKAGTIIVTGRNPDALEKLKKLGADVTISLTQSDDEIVSDFTAAYQKTPFDVVIDYLWGNPTELLLKALAAVPSQKTTKIITVGQMAGATISDFASTTFRSRDIVLLGSGMGSFSPKELGEYMKNELPEIFQYAASGKLVVDIETFPLEKISEAWNLNKTVVVRI